MQDKIRTIIDRLIKNDTPWLKEQAIEVLNKNPYWVLNYSHFGRTPFNKLVRGMVVQQPTQNFNGDPLSLIKSFPFIRFFNSGDPEAAAVDFSNAEMIEKLDGSMIGVFFPYGDPSKPEFHTRRMLSTYGPDKNLNITSFHGKTLPFLPTVKEYVDKLSFNDNDVKFTYVFEFIHELSKVLTEYKPKHYGLYLLGARNLETHVELNENELDVMANRIGDQRARRFDTISDYKDIEKFFAKMAQELKNFEGFIFRDKASGERIKVKDPKYVEIHHLLTTTSNKRLIPLIFKGETEEILAYFPHLSGKIDNIVKSYEEYLNNAVKEVQKWSKMGLEKKPLALLVFGPESSEIDKFTKNMIMSCYEMAPEAIYNYIDNELKTIALGKGQNNGSPKRLVKLINIEDDEDETLEEI